MHETLAQLMGQIEELEDRITLMEQKEPENEHLQKFREELAEKQRELARISDGCGTPHHH